MKQKSRIVLCTVVALLNAAIGPVFAQESYTSEQALTFCLDQCGECDPDCVGLDIASCACVNGVALVLADIAELEGTDDQGDYMTPEPVTTPEPPPPPLLPPKKPQIR